MKFFEFLLNLLRKYHCYQIENYMQFLCWTYFKEFNSMYKNIRIIKI